MVLDDGWRKQLKNSGKPKGRKTIQDMARLKSLPSAPRENAAARSLGGELLSRAKKKEEDPATIATEVSIAEAHDLNPR